MKIAKLLGLLFVASVGATAQILSVNVPLDMVHESKVDMGLGYAGKVEYSINSLYFDSVYVSLKIVPVGGDTTPLTLKSVTGDTGVIRINQPNMLEKHVIFFEVTNAGTGNYRARIQASSLISDKQKDIQSILNSLTKSEKANLCGTGNGFGDPNADQFIKSFTTFPAGKVPPIYMNDGPYGINYGWGKDNYHATCFPSTINLACTWDTSLAYLQGSRLAEEWRIMGRNCHLGPGMNIQYHPRGGRTAEYFAEDPYLSGHMAAAEVLGLQSKGVIATIKHFCANSLEMNRTIMSSTGDERTLQEIFLYNWVPAARVAWALMTAYSKVNGEWTGSCKYTVTDMLRNTWGYKSYVVSDWGGTYTPDSAVKYGIDMGANFTAPLDNRYIQVLSSTSAAFVDMHVSRILYAHEMLGDMKPGYNRYIWNNDSMESPGRKAIVRYVGTRSIILAKNDPSPDKPLLPLPKTGKTIAILSGRNVNFANGGEIAYNIQPGIHGSSNVYPTKYVPYAQGLNAYLSQIGNGASTILQLPTTQQLNNADYILVFVGPSGEGEQTDRGSATLGGYEGETAVSQALGATNGRNKTIVVYCGGASSLPGNWSKANAILIAHFPGDQQGLSLADVLFGDYNPAAKLTTTFYGDNSQIPPYEEPSNNQLTYPPSDRTHGYFRVDKLGGTPPLFHFGHGLSYTTFGYSDLKIFPTTITGGDRVRVRVTVTNMGTNPAATPDSAKEVVELYLSMPSTNKNLPVRVQDLRGFQAVTLAKGESKTVSLELGPEEMQVFNPHGADYSGNGAWEVLSGTYGVRVGTSSDRSEQPTVSSSFTVK